MGNPVAVVPETEDPDNKDNMAAPDTEDNTELHEAEEFPETVGPDMEVPES